MFSNCLCLFDCLFLILDSYFAKTCLHFKLEIPVPKVTKLHKFGICSLKCLFMLMMSLENKQKSPDYAKKTLKWCYSILEC